MSTTPRIVKAEDLAPDMFAELGGSAGVTKGLRDGTLVILPRDHQPTPPPARPAA